MQKLWVELRSSLWFVPGLLVFIAVVLAVGLVELDVLLADRLGAESWRALLGASPEGARGMLTAIASSMITVAGVTFSITIVTLSLASTQYTPRILRNFMRDRSNQAVLGVFVGIFTYCLVVLRNIRGGSGGETFVPVLAVFAGMLLALLSIGCLIFFIHHVAASIQASYILNAITQETVSVIEKLFPHELGDAEEPASVADATRAASWHSVGASASGYIQAIDQDELHAAAKEKHCELRLERIPGDFVVEGRPLLSLEQRPDERLAERLRRLFVIGDFRTVEQDAGFGIRQIVDIAMKALSPGVNDTSTAVSCLDYLSVLLSHLANRSLVPSFVAVNDTFRVTADARGFADYVAKSFDEIRLSAEGNVSIILQMLCALQRVVEVTRTAARRTALLEQAQVIVETAEESVSRRYDRERINGSIATLQTVFGVTADELPLLSGAMDA